MEFAIITIIALAALGVVAAVASHFDHDDDTITEARGCASCTGKEDCKLACLMEEKATKESIKAAQAQQ